MSSIFVDRESNLRSLIRPNRNYVDIQWLNDTVSESLTMSECETTLTVSAPNYIFEVQKNRSCTELFSVRGVLTFNY
jgi:hypothetical protein